MAENKKIKKCPVSLQPDIENLLQDLTPDDFASASSQEKEDFIQDRQSVSYWKDAWRRLKKNVVAMVALGVIIFLFLFAFVGPLLIPYGYDEFNDGAENLFPYHYTLEDQQRVDEEIASRTQSEVVDVDSMIEQAKAEAEAKGEKFTKKDEAILRAKAKTAAKNDTASESEESTDPDTVRKELRNISSDIQRKNLSVKQPARKFSHMSLEQICTDVIFLSVLCMVHEFLCQLVYLPHFSY